MTNLLPLAEGKYAYCSECNILLHQGFIEKFLKYPDEWRIDYKEIEISRSIIQKKSGELKQVIFELTQECNLRCKYCVYSGEYRFKRHFSKKSMDIDVARQGLDYLSLILSSRKTNKLSVGFYGGEPLLKFPLLKEIVGYAEKKFPGWDLSFKEEKVL